MIRSRILRRVRDFFLSVEDKVEVKNKGEVEIGKPRIEESGDCDDVRISNCQEKVKFRWDTQFGYVGFITMSTLEYDL